MLRNIAHIGIAVEDLDKVTEFYRSILGADVLTTKATPEMKISMMKIGDADIEFLQPISETGPIGKFVKKHGEGVHHICFEVNDIEHVLKSLSEKGIELIDKTPRQGLEGKVAFINPKYTNRVLIELLEKD
jgi:methylmalonyl-CoA/ethylmalonyl-CoA epimerase